ncbi:MAG: alginate O-acetyltransferase AlgF, partial [Gammaproteobacteria bacterium]|nr:alginate O-acetyltransferase AlgF [Gammaproteobacteria bacterium]
KTLPLKTTNGKTSIIADIAPDHLGFREINAMALNMAIFNGSIKLRETNQQQLHKDRVTNIAIIDSEQGIAIAIMLSNTNTRI